MVDEIGKAERPQPRDSLIGAHEDALVDKLQGKPSRAPVVTARLQPGSRLARYELGERLGAGAMGVVFSARDPQLDRQVAIKLLSSDLDTASGTEGRRRLLQEAKAMARLSHANVVQVFEVGEHGERIYIAMELVHGSTLRGWLDAKARTWAEVLDVFRAAGQGLAAAHRAGVVHRDFKPTNVLVSEDGVAKVADFGLAGVDRSVDAESVAAAVRSAGDSVTRTGAIIGTPAYMSPEQWLSEPAQPRSDQFAFCVALYEGLYGIPPFSARVPEQLAAQVLGGEITPPPRRTKVPRRIGRAVVRGLAPDPADRWPSMEVLLDELRPRKRPWIVGGSAVVVAAAAGVAAFRVGGPTPCARGAQRVEAVWNDARRSALHDAFAGTGLPYAPAAWQGVEADLEDYTQGWLAAYGSICEGHVAGERSDASLDSGMACLQRLNARLDGLLAVFGEPDDRTVGKAPFVVASLTAPAECMSPQEDPPPETEPVADVEAAVGRAAGLVGLGRYDDALPVAQEQVTAAQALKYGPTLARARVVYGHALAGVGRYDDAADVLQAAAVEAAGASLDQLAARAATRLVRVTGVQQSRHDVALTWAEFAGASLTRLGDPPAGRAALAAAVGNTYVDAGEYARAQEKLEGATQVLTELHPDGHPQALVVLRALGSCHLRAGRYDEAEAVFGRSEAMARKILPEGHPDAAYDLDMQGNVAYSRGRYAEAAEAFGRSLAVRERAFGPDHPRVADSLNNRGMALMAAGQDVEAQALFARALPIVEARLGAEHPFAGGLEHNLGLLASNQGRLADARRHYERAVEIRTAALGGDSVGVGQSLGGLANVVRKLGDPQQALELLDRQLAIQRNKLGAEHPAITSTLNRIGAAYADLGDHDEAAKRYEASVSLGGRALGKDHLDNAYALQGLSDALRNSGRAHEAATAAEQAVRLWEAAEAADADELAAARWLWAKALRATGNTKRAGSLAAAAATTDGISDELHAQILAWN